MYSQINNNSLKKETSKKTKRGSIIKDKKKSKMNSKNDFWDDLDINEQIYNNNNYNNNNFNNSSLENSQNNQNSYYNKVKSRSIEKDKNFTFFDKYKNLLKNENRGKNINTITFNYKERIKNKKDNGNLSVDMNKMSRRKNKNKKFDELSVFKRNQKWLENKFEKLNSAKEKIINKEEKEYQNIYQQYQNDLKRDKNFKYNEEDNVTLKTENFNFFMRLIKGRQEKERALVFKSTLNKVNCLKSSHYSGKHPRNISQRDMKRYMKFIHCELKQSNNQN